MLYFLVTCHGSYIHHEPLTSLQGPETATAITSTVEFFRKHGVQLDTIKMDNQSSPGTGQSEPKGTQQSQTCDPNCEEPHHCHTFGISQRLSAHLFGQMIGPNGTHTKLHPHMRIRSSHFGVRRTLGWAARSTSADILSLQQDLKF
jgi:hypothetical protein